MRLIVDRNTGKIVTFQDDDPAELPEGARVLWIQPWEESHELLILPDVRYEDFFEEMRRFVGGDFSALYLEEVPENEPVTTVSTKEGGPPEATTPAEEVLNGRVWGMKSARGLLEGNKRVRVVGAIPQDERPPEVRLAERLAEELRKSGGTSSKGLIAALDRIAKNS